jgi:aminoglycoside 2'-N-acetyltransferase I
VDVIDEKSTSEVRLQVGHTSEFEPAALAQARDLLYIVFDDITDDDWEHSLGGMHTIAWRGTEIVGHASVVQRRLVHRGEALRTGYVEGVGVHPALQGQGIGSRMMAELERIIGAAYDVGALGASDAAVEFYEHRGWVKWGGTSWALTPEGRIRTPDEDESIFVLQTGRAMDLTGELTCDWRAGDVW